MGVQAVKIDTEGVATVVDLGENTLKGLQDHICCRWVDVVRFDGPAGGVDIWIDDEGAVLAEPVLNELATELAELHGLVNGYSHQPLFGTVVLASSNEDGDTVDLPDFQRDAALRLSAIWRERRSRV